MDPEVAIDRINAAYRNPTGHRSLHARGQFYDGTFTATPEAASLCRAAHLQGETVPVLVRWSNAGGNPKVPDKALDIRGMAVKFRTPVGATDLLAQTAPRFPVRTPEAFVQLTEAITKPHLLPLFLARHPDAVVPFLVNVKAKSIVPPHSFAEKSYFPIHAYGWLAADGALSWVRYRFVPQATAADRLDQEFTGRERLREEMEARLAHGAVRFDLWVTVAAPGDDPHDPMSVWKGARDFVAGTVEVTATLPDPEAGGGLEVFDPVRVIDGLTLSEDPILQYRPRAYAVSIARRSAPH